MVISPLQQVSVLGLPLHLHHNYIQWLSDRLEQGQSTHVVTLNAEMVMQAQKNPDLAQVIQHADLVVPDGSGVVLYLKWRGQSQSPRVPGIEVAEHLLATAAQEGWSVFFYGGQPGTPDMAQHRWQQQYPHLNIVGTQHGYLSQGEQETLVQQLEQQQPQVILVGLGVPRQELWIHNHRHYCPRSLWIGVGGSFDIWAGRKQRAPQWLQDNHLEWLYRLYQEPWRWQRMLALPHFAWATLAWKPQNSKK